VFSLTGRSPRIPREDLPRPGDGFALIDLQSVGVRHLPAAEFGADFLEFAISTFGRRAHPNYPAEFDIYIDNDNDGEPDFVVFNAENGGFSATGQNAVFVANLANDPVVGTAVFFTDADLDSGNVIFTVPMNATAGAVNVGIQPGTTFGFSVYAFDNYFTGELSDAVENMLFTPGNARFGVAGDPFGTVAARSLATVPVTTATVPDAATTESGLLLMYRRNTLLESEVIKVR
jgi:minor extracellular serine protease Vpr